MAAADRSEYREAAGAIAEAVIRSVELIVQPAGMGHAQSNISGRASVRGSDMTT